MKHFPTLERPVRTATVALVSAAATAALTLPGLALAHDGHGHGVPAPPASPTSDNQIQNIDQVKTAIKAYYGDTVSATPDPVTGATLLHQMSPTGAYARQVERIATRAGKALAHHHKSDPRKAILFDIDDTTLNTFSYEIYSSFVYNPVTNGDFVDVGSASIFPAVPGMVGLEHKAIADGYKVFFLTGRPTSQTDGTLANLRDAGYTVDDANVFLKDATAVTEPWLKPCVDTSTTPATFTCNTIQYKSKTRRYIEKHLHYDIVANFGDQFSDLKGGFADSRYKIPNPMYYLP